MRELTQKQIKAIKNVVENGGNKQKALLDAGYSKAVAKTPSKVFGSRVVGHHLEESGITKEKIHEKLSSLLESENERIQLKAVDISCKLLGMYAPRQIEGKHTIATFSLSALRRKMEENGVEVISNGGCQ